MKDVYEQLAEKLNSFPHGFPSCEDRLDLKLLHWVFSPEEVEVALKLSGEPETLDVIASKLEKPVKDVEAILGVMIAKGQIFCFNAGGTFLYVLPPYFPGIHEGQVVREDKTVEQRQEYAGVYNEYYPLLLGVLGQYGPALTRVVPVSTAIEPGLKIHRLDDARRMIEEAKSIMLIDCICRKEKALLGKACSHSLDVCLMFSDQENMLTEIPLGRIVTQDEALDAVLRAEKEGLVHTTYNADESGVTCLCACCPCCSGFLSGLAKFKSPYIVAHSRFVAQIDPDKCSQCGTCAEERCPMNAVVQGETYQVSLDRCIGCGVCKSTCPTGAIELIERPGAEEETPPSDLREWAVQRSDRRWKQ
jgi:NAD-dependent dihydropyrimidine dehydrogenase PreA subunit